jgi:hypothetical protein
MKTIEEWKDVKDYEGVYQISNYGNLRRWFPYKARFKPLKKLTHPEGYVLYHLSLKDIMVSFRAHRLVAEAFIPNPNNLPVVNHIDCIRDNNYFKNLEWCDVTHNNNNYAFTHGNKVSAKGQDCTFAKLKDEDVISILKKSRNGEKNFKIALEYNISQSTVCDILKGRRWKHITLAPQILEELKGGEGE